MKIKSESIIGCLLGSAVGDALGLCFENLSRRRHGIWGEPDAYHFFFGKGMVSDDTEHMCMLAQSLIASAGEPEVFIRQLAWKFRFWLLGLPAGIGYATLRSVLKLWLGFSGKKSGVFSAGNGPAMRSPLIGVCYGYDDKKMRELARCSTRITHTDPKAEFGALAAALAAYMASQENTVSPRTYYDRLQNLLTEDVSGAPNHKSVSPFCKGGRGDFAFEKRQLRQKSPPAPLCEKGEEFLERIRQAVISVEKGELTEDFASEIGLDKGIGGYMYHTVPPVIHCWLTHQDDFETGVKTIIRCGGDTDTTAAILGAIIGASVGTDGIPGQWLDELWEWPRTKLWMSRLGKQLAEVCESGSPQQPISAPFWGIAIRNLVFTLIVLLHGLRRLFPPY